MIFSTFISCCSFIHRAFSNFLSKLSKILGICKTHISTIFFGNISGFVSGPKILTQFDDLKAQKEYFSRLILISSNAGIGFVISFVGKFLWGNFIYGLSLYTFQIIISVILNSLIFFKVNHYKDEAVICKNTSFCSSLIFAISSSTNAIISICSFTIIFSTISKLLIKILNIPTNSIFSTLIFSLFDVTEGVKSASNLGNSLISAFFVGFALGFGGISIAFQIFSFCDGFSLNKSKYFLSKIVQGILCGVFSLFYVQIFKIAPTKSTIQAFSNNSLPFLSIVFLMIFLIFTIKSKFKSRISKKC